MNINDIIKQIVLAFNSVEWVETSLKQFRLTDLHGMSGNFPDDEWEKAGEEWYAAKKSKMVNSWLDIEAEMLELGYGLTLLSHMPSKEFTFYLPAYLVFALRRYESERDLIIGNEIIDSLIFNLTPFDQDGNLCPYNISQYQLINFQQASVIVLVLRLLIQLATEDEEFDRINEATVALGYWQDRLSRS